MGYICIHCVKLAHGGLYLNFYDGIVKEVTMISTMLNKLLFNIYVYYA